jgi:hypothetical protein
MWWHTRRNQISLFRRNGRVHLNRRGRQFSRLLGVEVCTSAAVMLDTPCSEVAWRVLVTRSIRQFPLHFLSSTSPCAITFQLDSTWPGLKLLHIMQFSLTSCYFLLGASVHLTTCYRILFFLTLIWETIYSTNQLKEEAELYFINLILTFLTAVRYAALK